MRVMVMHIKLIRINLIKLYKTARKFIFRTIFYSKIKLKNLIKNSFNNNTPLEQVLSIVSFKKFDDKTIYFKKS